MVTLAIQESVENLQQNVTKLLNDTFPIDYQDHKIIVENVYFEPPKDTSRKSETKHFIEEKTMAGQVRGDVIIYNPEGKRIIHDKKTLIANIPYPTSRGTYIIKGDEKVFINQMLIRQGVYVRPERVVGKKNIIEGEVRAGKKRFTIVYDVTSETFVINDLGMDFGYQGKKLDLVAFLLFMGVSRSEIENAIGNDDVFEKVIKEAEKVTSTRIHNAFFDSEVPETDDEIREKINNYLNDVLKFDEKALKIQDLTIGKSFSSFTPDAFLQTMKQLVKEKETPGATPLTDDIRFKEILNGEAVIAKGVEKGIFEWTKKVKERIRYNNVKSSNIKPSGWIEKELGGIYNSSLSERVDSSNPLDLAQKKKKLTMGGPGGLNDRAVTEANRNLLESEFGKIDPIETPQSSKLGITQHLAQDAFVKNGEIFTKYHPVKNGIIDTNNIVDDIDVFDEYDEYIAFHDLENIEETGGEKRFKSDKVRVRHKGDFIDVPKNKVTLVDLRPDSHLGKASALVPFSSHNDGSRMLMGSSMQRQALPLENAEAPLVQSIADSKTNQTVEELVAEENSQVIKAGKSGVVTRITNDFIEITDENGEVEKHEKLNYYSPGKSGGYINHKPTVSVGDKVKKGQLIADGWQTKGGKLALGKNTLVGYMSMDGYNHEDGVVVSESWARSMASEEMKTLEYTVDFGEGTFDRKETKDLLKKLMVSDGITKKLDSDGVIKKGQEVTPGDIFVGVVAKKEQADLSMAERILRRSIDEDPKDTLRDKSKYAKGYLRGKVVDVDKTFTDDSMKVTIKLLTLRELSEGDKLSGRHGNKGTISKILPDDEMPRTEDGEPLQLIFSPLAVPSRKNVGQLLEVNAGMVAKKKGMDAYKIQNFDKREREKLYKEMEELGMADGKVNLINPKTGKTYENKVTVGPMFIMRLDHNAESKIAATSYGAEDPVTGLPRKLSGAIDGDRTSPQTIGDMEFWSLTSAGAVHNIHEMTTLKSDGSGAAEDKTARLKIFNAIKHGTSIPSPATPKTLQVLQDEFMAAGIQAVPLKDGKETTLESNFNQMMLRPVKPETIESLAPNEVIEPKTFNSRTGEEDEKGLYSKETFGKNGDQWGRITLETPIPNPIFLSPTTSSRPYEAMLQTKGIENKHLLKVVEGGHFMVLDPKDSGQEKYSILSAEEVEMIQDVEGIDIHAVTGPSVVAELLKDVDLKEELRHTEEMLKNPNNDVDSLSRYESHYKTLTRAIDNDYKPTDFLMPFVPVLPVKYRQPVHGGSSDKLVEDGITLLYQQLMKRNEEYQRALDTYGGDKSLIDKQTLAEIERDRFETIQNIVGTKTFKDNQRGGLEYEGILSRMTGKTGFIRSKLQSKTQNYSGRSVIVVDPELDMDEVGLPEDMAAEMFKPHIQRELQKQRFTAKEIKKIMDERTPEFRKALSKAVEDEVVIMNRQPSLHRHSVQGLKPIIRWDNGNQKSKAIGLNAIVTTGFNADFDGDSLLNSVFVRYKEVDIEPNSDYNESEGVDSMPLSGDEKIKFKNGLINLRDFPRLEKISEKDNVEVYSVPDDIEVLTVWNNEKKWLPVESFSVHKDLTMLEVKTNTSRTVQVSDDHSLVSVDDELNYERVPATMGMTLPRLREPINSKEFNLKQELSLPEVKENKYNFIDSIKLDPKSGYLFGAYIGDGWVSHNGETKGKHAICMADSGSQVIGRVKDIIEGYMEEGNLHISSTEASHDFNGKDSFCIKHTWFSAKFAELLRQEIGNGSENKKLPSFWIESPEGFRWGLLSGLIDTDGSVSVNKKRKVPQTNINYTTISRSLAYEIVGLAHSLNLTASVTITQTPKEREVYVITFTQESIATMKKRLWLANEYKNDVLKEFKLTESAKRNKYTPKLSDERLTDLMKKIGSPRIKNKKGELIVDEADIPKIKKRKSLYAIVHRVKKENTAITRDTALELFELIPDFFEIEFWAKWKEMVLDENVEWELVTSIVDIPFITEAYDLTIPPNYTMVTESGIVVYDTMAVHLPITEKAKQEVKEKMMPSQNILNPTSNSVIMELKHEMQLGIYYLTRDKAPTGTPKKFKDYASLEKAYFNSDIRTYEAAIVNVPQHGEVKATAGMHMFNSALPTKYISYTKHKNVKKGHLEQLIKDIMQDTAYGPAESAKVINKLKTLGFKASTMSAISIGVRDFDPIMNVDKDELFKDAEKEINVADFIDKKDALEVEKAGFVKSKIDEMLYDGVLGEDNHVNITLQSGARGGAGSLSAMGGIVGKLRNVSSEDIRPLKSSLLEGAKPDEFWDLANDSRKGIFDRSVATSGPGELSRALWTTNKQTLVTERDCGDLKGIILDLNKPSDSKGLYGRILLEDVQLKGGGVIKKRKHKPLTPKEVDKIRKDAVNKSRIRVRSPLSCKTEDGICQNCYGMKPGSMTNELVPIGEPVGSIASQAIGEPAAQSIMKTFHTGGGGNELSSAFEGTSNILNLTKPRNTAVVATEAGTVTEIINDVIKGTKVKTTSKTYDLKKLPIATDIKVGVNLKPGDVLTRLKDSNGKVLSVVDPRDVLKYGGVSAAQAYLTEQLEDSFTVGGIDHIDRRHSEIVVNNMTNRGVVTDSGTSGLNVAQTFERKKMETFNNSRSNQIINAPLTYEERLSVIGAEAAQDYYEGIGFGPTIVKKGEIITEEIWEKLRQKRKFVKVKKKAVQFNPTLQGIGIDNKMYHDNWLDSAGKGDAKRFITKGTGEFSVDKLDNPFTQRMTGRAPTFGSSYESFAQKMKDRFGDILV